MRFVWLTGRDRVAYAVNLSAGRRTACGVPAVLEQLAWPERSKCEGRERALGLRK
jgi:hypothetical protein